MGLGILSRDLFPGTVRSLELYEKFELKESQRFSLMVEVKNNGGERTA